MQRFQTPLNEGIQDIALCNEQPRLPMKDEQLLILNRGFK